MTDNPFFQDLITRREDISRLPGLEILHQFCDGIKQFVNGPIDCVPVPGHSVNYGQEYKVILSYYPAASSQTLIRAYLNMAGTPYLDLYDGNGPTPCDSVEDMRDRLRQFLQSSGVAGMLERYRGDAESRR
jgi:hypothetical protein